MNFGLLMLHIKLAVGQWTLDMVATALAAALILRAKRYRIRIEHVPAADSENDKAAEALTPESGQDTLAGNQEAEGAETYTLAALPS